MTVYYTTSDSVYAVAGITSSEIPVANVNEFIEDACDEVDTICNTTFLLDVDSGTADAGAGDNELDDTAQTWVADAYIGYYCWIYSGTGIDQIREITDNTTTKLTLNSNWSTNPDATSLYRVVASNPSTDPYVSQSVDGNGSNDFFLERGPLIVLQALKIDDVSITSSYVYQYKEPAKLKLSTDAEASYFNGSTPQLIDLEYWYGKYPLPRVVRKFTTIVAAINTLVAQIGGTFDDVTSFSVPHMTGSLGEPYTNIREAVARLEKERDRLRPLLPIYQAIVEN